MEHSELVSLSALLDGGELELLQDRLAPLLEAGDADARYLACQFSIDPALTGEEFDKRQVRELISLSKLGHKYALFDLAWRYRHGDHVEQSTKNYWILMAAATGAGHPGAADLMRRELAAALESSEESI